MKNKQLLFVGLFSLMISADVVLSKLKVASFNIQVLGVTKVGKCEVVAELVKVRMLISCTYRTFIITYLGL